MVMRQIQLLILVLAFSLTGCNIHSDSKAYPNSDAVFRNLTKTFILNEDGSLVRKTEITQKLLTYRAFNSLYGDTRISYNPSFEHLEVTESYTQMANGKRVPTPENGYNEVLPSFCADSKAYNHLREMVVTHTGLEREAVIHCAYQIESLPEERPFLVGNEPLLTTSPIERLKIVIKVPRGTNLSYSLLFAAAKPTIQKGSQEDTYTWKFRDLPQHLSETHQPGYSTKVPRLIFSTLATPSDALKLLTRGDLLDKNINEATAQKIIGLTQGKKTLPEKALAVQHLVVNDLKLLQIPQPLIAFKSRGPQQTWDSNSGTAMEKSVLMVALLRALGIDAKVGLVYPTIFDSAKASFLSVAAPFVMVNAENAGSMYLSATHLNDNAAALKHSGYSIHCLKSGAVAESMRSPKGAIHISGNLTLSKNGQIDAALKEEFSDAYNPFYRILGDASSNYMPGIKGEIQSSSPQQSEIRYKGAYNTPAEIRGGYCFVTLPQSSYGVASKNMLPLPSAHRSELWFGHPLTETYQMTLSVPPGWQLINENLAADFSTSDGHLSIKIEPDGNTINILKQIAVINPLISPDNYVSFKDLINMWHLNKYRQLVFRIPKND